MYKFSKKEHLCSRFIISDTLKKGKTIHARIQENRIKLIYCMESEERRLSDIYKEDVHLQTMMWVPKSNMRKATKRNRCKRLLKETFRVQKKPIIEILAKEDKRMSLILFFYGNPSIEIEEMSDLMRKGLGELARKIK